MWEVTLHNILGALVIGLAFGFGFTVGTRIAAALFGPPRA